MGHDHLEQSPGVDFHEVRAAGIHRRRQKRAHEVGQIGADGGLKTIRWFSAARGDEKVTYSSHVLPPPLERQKTYRHTLLTQGVENSLEGGFANQASGVVTLARLQTFDRK